MKSKFPPYVLENTWKVLPIDGSMVEWAREFGCSRKLIAGTLDGIQSSDTKKLYLNKSNCHGRYPRTKLREGRIHTLENSIGN